MARIKYTAIVSDIRGKLAGTAFTKGGSGSFVFSQGATKRSGSQLSAKRKNNFASIQRYWSTLTTNQRLGWELLASRYIKKDSFSDSRLNSGMQLFCELNRNRYMSGQALISDAPALSGVSMPISMSAINNSIGPSVIISFSPSPVPAGNYLLVYATKYKSPGVRNFDFKYKFIAAIPAGTASAYDITAAYTSAWGVPPVGGVIGYEVQYQNSTSGQRGLLLRSISTVIAAFDPEAEALINAFSVVPSMVVQLAINDWFIAIKASEGVLLATDVFDRVFSLAFANNADSRLDWMYHTSSLSAVGGMAFTANDSWLGNGSTGYFNSNYNPVIDGVVYQQNSNSLGIYSKTEQQSNARVEAGFSGVGSTTQMQPRLFADTIAYAGNSAAFLFAPNASSLQLNWFQRSASNVFSGYRQGILLGSGAQLSAALPSKSIYIAASNEIAGAAGFSTKKLSFAFIGRPLSNPLAFANATQAYLSVVGGSI